MPVINIQTKQAPVTSVGTSTYGDNIYTLSTDGVNYITEELTKQISPGNITYFTSYQFLPYTLEVFLNGIALSKDSDYFDLITLNGFEFILHNIGLSKTFSSDNSSILVKYVKKIN